MENLRICFAGTPAFAAAHLQSLLNAKHNIVAVYTQPDRPSGRGKKLHASPVKQIALEHSIPVHQPANLKSDDQALALASLNVDLLIVVAYGLILPKLILDIPKYGCLNVHASLLPRWRGAAPIERALLAGDKVSGVTIMQMDEGLDTGAMLNTEAVAINPHDDRLILEEKLTIAGQTALLRTVENLENYRENAVNQLDSASSYAAKLVKGEALIDWNKPAAHIDRQVRAGIGRSPAYSFLDGQRLRIIEAKISKEVTHSDPGSIVFSGKTYFTVCCESSSLDVFKVQLPGKNPTPVQAIKNSKPSYFQLGTVFSSKEPEQV